MKKAKLLLLAMLMVLCLVFTVACETQPAPHDKLENAKLALGDNKVELYVEDGRTATFTATEAGRYTFSLKAASSTVTVKKSGETKNIELPYMVRLAANETVTLELASSAKTEMDSVTIVVTKQAPLADAVLAVGENAVNLYVEEGRKATFTATETGRYTFSLKADTDTITFKKVGTTTENIELPFTVRLAANENVTLALSSVAKTEQDSVTIVVTKQAPLADVALEKGDNEIEMYVDEGRTATFTATAAGRYDISLKTASQTVTIKDAQGEDITLPHNVYLEENEVVTLKLSSTATTEKDSVTIVVAEDNNNYVASIDVKNKLCPDDGKMSFITAESYSNITEISFKAKTGTTSSWWGISLAESKAEAGIYKWSMGTLPATNGEWVLFTFKFANGVCSVSSTNGYSFTANVANKDYYIYFIGAKGEDFGGNVLLDDFTIVADGTTYVDDFQKGFDKGLFDADTVWNEGGAPVSEEVVNDIVIEDKNNYVAFINTRRHTEEGKMSFITKDAYAGLTEISFKVKANATKSDGSDSWWGITISEKNTRLSIYDHIMPGLPNTKNDWVEYTYKFEGNTCSITSSVSSTPLTVGDLDMTKEYYIFLFSAKGEYDGLYIDDFVIKTSDGTTLTENFNKNFDEWLFEAEGDGSEYSPVRRLVDNSVEVKTAEINYVASIDVQNKLCTDAGKSSFITKTAYSGITEISFRAQANNQSGWWGISLSETTDKDGYYMPLETLPTTNGEWVTFTLTFADGKCTIKSSAELNKTVNFADGNYYIFLIGARGEFEGSVLLDDFTIKTSDGNTVTEDFQKDSSEWLFAIDGAVTKVADGVIEA